MDHFIKSYLNVGADSIIPGYINILKSHLHKKSNYPKEFGDLYPFIIISIE